MSASPEGTLAHIPEVLKIFPVELGAERVGESKRVVKSEFPLRNEDSPPSAHSTAAFLGL